MTSVVTLRPVDENDLEFLYRVYASTREDVNQADWSQQRKEDFLRMQFRAQHVSYQQQFPAAENSIILANCQPVGRLCVDRCADEIRIIDIALLTEHRGRGIGGQVMQDLLDEAAVADKTVRIHVLRDNIALRLYDRLGFRTTEDTGIYCAMEWIPRGICGEK